MLIFENYRLIRYTALNLCSKVVALHAIKHSTRARFNITRLVVKRNSKGSENMPVRYDCKNM